MQKKPTIPRIYRRPGMPVYWATFDTPRRTFPGDAGDVYDLAARAPAAVRQAGCTFANGPSGRVLACDGSSAGLADFDSRTLPTGNAARTVVVRAATTYIGSSDRYFFSYGAAAINQGFGLGVVSGGHVVFTQLGASIISTRTVADGAYHHIAITHDGATQRLYVDGVADAVGTLTVATAGTSGRLGCYIGGTASVLACTLDHVAAYDRALSAAEVARDAADPWRRLRRPFRSAVLSAGTTTAPAMAVLPPRSLSVYTGQAIRGAGN